MEDTPGAKNRDLTCLGPGHGGRVGPAAAPAHPSPPRFTLEQSGAGGQAPGDHSGQKGLADKVATSSWEPLTVNTDSNVRISVTPRVRLPEGLQQDGRKVGPLQTTYSTIFQTATLRGSETWEQGSGE